MSRKQTPTMNILPCSPESSQSRYGAVPVIDLFAGPGGLGEGFSWFKSQDVNPFKISLSIEKDKNAHETLKLRSFFRCFSKNEIPEEYYQFVRGEIDLERLYSLHPSEHETAKMEAWNAELGKLEEAEIDRRIKNTLNGYKNWVLIGGPPCQAYSTAGRARIRATKGYVPEKDNRHFLYKEYLRIIACHWPAIFIMENVRGILSSRLNGKRIFNQILDDLKNPAVIFNGYSIKNNFRYRIYSLVKTPEMSVFGEPEHSNINDYTITSEDYGIPQARHRVILLGVREDLWSNEIPTLKKQKSKVSVHRVISGLPRLRSGFSKGEDSKQRWMDWLDRINNEGWYKKLAINPETEDVHKCMYFINEQLRCPQKNRGNEFIYYKVGAGYLSDWYLDERLRGVCNSSTRAHLETDLYRYFYAACFAKVKKRSPILRDFPQELLPDHKNARNSKTMNEFSDRFRVQIASKPSTTIMSHISKDGHYYIHYDPSQCRSLTVREAARLQTFPDNYFFCGSRTQQYSQVGNAVPPYLAYQIAEVVNEIFIKLKGPLNGQSHERKTKLEHVPNKGEKHKT